MVNQADIEDGYKRELVFAINNALWAGRVNRDWFIESIFEWFVENTNIFELRDSGFWKKVNWHINVEALEGYLEKRTVND